MSKQSSVSRRTVLGGMAAAAAAPLIGGAARANTVRPPARLGKGARLGGKLRYGHSVSALPDGRLLVIGGYHEMQSVNATPPSSSVQIFDPRTGEWFDAAPLKAARAQHASVTMPDGRVYVLGGFSHIGLSSVEIYDPTRNTWSAGAPLKQAIYGHTAAALGNSIAISGGQTGIPVQIYNPKLMLRNAY